MTLPAVRARAHARVRVLSLARVAPGVVVLEAVLEADAVVVESEQSAH